MDQIYGDEGMANTVEANAEPDELGEGKEDRTIDLGKSLQQQNFESAYARNKSFYDSDTGAESAHNQMKEPEVVQPDVDDSIFGRGSRRD